MISGWAGRHRRALLLAGVAVAAGYVIVAYLELPGPGWPPSIVVAVALLVLAVLDHRRPRPTALVLGRGEFAAPPSASAVCVALAMLLVAAGGLGTFVRQARVDGRWLPGLAVAAVWLAVTGVVFVSAWRGGDVRLRPDGVRTGRRLLPWEALDPSYPAVRGRAADQLALGLAAGGTRILRTDDVDARFLGSVIRFYAHRPAHRAAIGTAAGYGRLIGSLDGDARLPDVPANRDLIEFLRHQARPGKADRWDLDGWEMHVHPDLQERMRELAGDVVAVHGLLAVVVDGVGAAVALGTGTVLLRLPAPPPGLRPDRPVPPLSGRGWYAVDAWSSDPGRLAGALREAREYAERAGERGHRRSAHS
jgi:hypothetical protein